MGLAANFVAGIEDERIKYAMREVDVRKTPHAYLILVYDLSVREMGRILGEGKTTAHLKLRSELYDLPEGARALVVEKIEAHKQTSPFADKPRRNLHCLAAEEYLRNGYGPINGGNHVNS